MARNSIKSQISLTDEERDLFIKDIQYYFQTERDENLGDLGAGFILDFFLEKIAPTLYNHALDDAKHWLTSRLEELDYAYDELKK